jgi:hypothetical protein
MEHAERRRWCEMISDINEKMNADGGDDTSRRVDLRQLV